MAVNIVWFKRDLRFTDHAPLELALKLDEPTLMIYLIEPKLLRNPHYRGRHWQFIGQSLEDLQHTAEALGHRIEVLEGDAVDAFNEVHRKLGITRLLSYEETGLDLTFQRDQAVAKFCQSAGIEWREFQTNGVERGRRDRKGWNRSWHRFMTTDPHQIELRSMKSISAEASEQLNSLRSTKHRQWVRPVVTCKPADPIRHSKCLTASSVTAAGAIKNSFPSPSKAERIALGFLPILPGAISACGRPTKPYSNRKKSRAGGVR